MHETVRRPASHSMSCDNLNRGRKGETGGMVPPKLGQSEMDTNEGCHSGDVV